MYVQEPSHAFQVWTQSNLELGRFLLKAMHHK